jgi:hypothetical protein
LRGLEQNDSLVVYHRIAKNKFFSNSLFSFLSHYEKGCFDKCKSNIARQIM